MVFMAEIERLSSNSVFDILADWNECLKAESIDPQKAPPDKTKQCLQGPSI